MYSESVALPVEPEFALTNIASPCILVCSIDMKSGYCFGCGRTRDEIAGWMGYSNAERAQIMETLPARLETVERKPRRETRRQRLARERGETPNRQNGFGRE